MDLPGRLVSALDRGAEVGADDLDGTIVEERIYHDAGATTNQGLRRAELLQLIRKAGRDPQLDMAVQVLTDIINGTAIPTSVPTAVPTPTP